MSLCQELYKWPDVIICDGINQSLGIDEAGRQQFGLLRRAVHEIEQRLSSTRPVSHVSFNLCNLRELQFSEYGESLGSGREICRRDQTHD